MYSTEPFGLKHQEFFFKIKTVPTVLNLKQKRVLSLKHPCFKFKTKFFVLNLKRFKFKTFCFKFRTF